MDPKVPKDQNGAVNEVRSDEKNSDVIYVVATEKSYGGFDLVPCEGRICASLEEAKNFLNQNNKIKMIITQYNLKTHENSFAPRPRQEILIRLRKLSLLEI